jgi:hypothetical protein
LALIFIGAGTIIFNRIAFFSKQNYSMHKTLHKKLTEKQLFSHSKAYIVGNNGGSVLEDRDLLREIAKDLLQPRPQAITNLLKAAREM